MNSVRLAFSVRTITIEPINFKCFAIHQQLPNVDCLRCGDAVAVQQRLDPGHQFKRLEWFDEVIIGSQLKAFDFLGGLAFGREHQQRNIVGCAQLAAQLPAIHIRHHHIQDNHIGFERLKSCERFHAIRSFRDIKICVN